MICWLQRHHLVVPGPLNGFKEAPCREAGILGSHISVTGFCDQHAHLTHQLAQLPAGQARAEVSPAQKEGDK